MLTESLNIYVIDKDGNKVTFPNVEGMQPAIVDVNLNRERMAGAPTNTSTLMYPVCLDSYWTKKEFIEIGSERYYVKQVPTSEKNTEDTRYKHEITFVSERDILENVFFFDCVTKDGASQIGDKPRSNTTDFSFYGDLNELVQRLNDSLSYSKIYDPKGENGFCIVIDDDVEIGEAKEVSMTDAYFATAMQGIYNVFEVPYYWVGKVCHVGYQENEITEPFEYGSGNGLLSVQKTNAEFRLINRITGQGSADNIPYYYPNSDPNGTAIFTTENFDKSKVSQVSLAKIFQYTTDIYGLTLNLCKNKQESYSANLLNYNNYCTKVKDAQFADQKWNFTLDGVSTNLAPKVNELTYRGFYGNYSYQGTGHSHSSAATHNVGTSFMWCYLVFDMDAIGTQSKIDFSNLKFVAKINKAYKGNGDDSATTTTIPSVTFSYDYAYYIGGLETAMSKEDVMEKIKNSIDGKTWNNQMFFGASIEGLNSYTNSSSRECDFILSHKHSILIECQVKCDFGSAKDIILDVSIEPQGELNFIYNVGEQMFVALPSGKTKALSESGISISNTEDIPFATVDYEYDGETWIAKDLVSVGDDTAKIIITDRDFINPISKLMPSVYREQKGAERFYNAKNETYTNENGEFYSFNNPYAPSEPLEGKQDFEDIKPTINGITNEDGELFGEIAEVAFDDTDSDDLMVEDAKDANTTSAKPVHPYFYVKLHTFSGDDGFNLFKQGLAQGAMTFNFITGSCAGCSFKVQVSEGKQVDNHYEFENLVQVDEQGNIVAGDSGDKINASNPIASQQDTMTNYVWIALEKDNSTFGVLMPNATNNYRPSAGDKFVITNILLPTQYITAAEKRLDAALVKYMSENNDEKFTFSIKFSRIYLQEHPEIADKINENTKLHVKYNNVDYPLYVSSYSRKSDDNILDEISVELSEKLTITQNKSKEQMDSIMGNVNEQINSAIQNNNNNTSQGVSANDINSLKALLGNKLSRVSDDTAAGIITFLQGTNWGSFTSETGAAMTVDPSTGQTYMEVDRLKVRLKAFFEQLEIQKVGYVGGKLIVTKGQGVDILDVENIYDTEGNVSAYRCYFLGEQEGRKIDNLLRVKDQMICKDFNVSEGTTDWATNKYYWRLATAVSSDVVKRGNNVCHWVDLSATDCDTNSDIPEIGDTICHLGNREDTDRQGAEILSVVDANSPSFTIYSGINSYSLVNKEYIDMGVVNGKAYCNIYGSTYIGDRDRKSGYLRWNDDKKTFEIKGTIDITSPLSSGGTIGGSITDAANAYKGEFDAFTSNVNEVIGGFQAQIDGVIETWFYEPEPTLGNEPAVNWTDNATKDKHLGDLYYSKEGKAYRFQKDGDNYVWQIITDTDITKALEEAKKANDAANAAQGTADSKMKVFVNTPTNSDEYSIGDMWVNATYPADGSTYSNEILKCKEGKAAGAEFRIAHWEKASKYTDDTKANEALTKVGDLQTDVTELGESFNILTNTTLPALSDGIITTSEKENIRQALMQVQKECVDVINAYTNLTANYKSIYDKIAADVRTNFATAYTNLMGSATLSSDGTITYTSGQGGAYGALVDNINALLNKEGNLTTNEIATINNNIANFNIKYNDFQNRLVGVRNDIEKTLDTRITDVDEQLGGYAYLKKIVGGKTTIDGGLVLTTMLGTGYEVTGGAYKIMSGISGLYETAKSVAIWAGGSMIDKFVYYDAESGKFNVPADVNPANFLVRMDGTGYAAGGNFWWDNDGKIHADPQSFLINEQYVGNVMQLFQLHYKVAGDTAFTNVDYVTPTRMFNGLELSDLGLKIGDTAKLYIKDGVLFIEGDLAVTGGITMYASNGVTSGLLDQVYAILDSTKFEIENGVITIKGEIGDGKVKGATLGGVAVTLNANGILEFDAYPTTLPASDVYAWAKAATKPTYSWGEITEKPTSFTPSAHTHDDRYYTESEIDTKLGLKLDTSLKGAADGLATLDSSGKVPSSQLPSYVDDVLEYTNKAAFPSTGESGKIYIDKATNLTYRWDGTSYVEISQSLALGETSSTAYAGDKGKKNAEDIAALQTGKADKATTLSGYGITDAYTKTEVNTKLTDGSVTKIGTKDVGSATLPIYLKAGVPTACNTTLGVSITGNSATTTKLANARTLWGQSFDGSANVSGNMTGVGQITFSYLTRTNGRALLYQQMADNDYFRIYVGGTASNAGYAEIATADDGNEPIYIRQYSGVFSSVVRTLTLLDGSGNTSLPGTLTAPNATISNTLKVGAIPVTNSSTGILKIDGNLVVTGGITMYATDGVVSGLMEQILVDGTTIGKKADGTLYAINTGNVRSIIMGSTTYTPNDSGAVTLPEKVTWANIEGKPSSFTPSSHTHAISQITNLQATLDGKAAASHTHAIADITNISSASVSYASSAGNADTVDGYHASSLWRSNGAIWNPGTNVSLSASANNQKWSFDIYRNGYTGCFWHVWDSSLRTMLKVNADNGKVYAPYNFVGNLEGNASSATKLTSSAGSATLPIYFSDGKPVACTASSVFSNLSNSGNNISVTVAGQNRTLTVGYASNADMVDGYNADSFIKKHTEYNFFSNDTAPYNYVWLCRIGNINRYSGMAITLDVNSRYHKHYQINMLIGTGQYAYSSSSISINKSDGAPNVYYVRTANGSDVGYDYFDIYVTCEAWNTGGYKIMQTSVDGGLSFTNKCTLVDSVPSGAVAVGLMYSSVNYSTSSGNSDTCDGLHVHGGRNNEANKIVRTDGSGYLKVGYINSSNGHEKNASSPTYVWGSNSSDSYLRSYQTSKLAVYTASKWATARTLTLTGSVTGSVSIDGSGNVSLATTTNHTHSQYLPLAGGTMTAGARISHADGNLYLGRSDNNGWLMCQDICSQEGSGDTYWSLRTDGSCHIKNTTILGTLYVSSTVKFAGLEEGTSTVTDNTEILTSWASNNGFADSSGDGKVYRRDAILLYNYIKGKTDSAYLSLTGGTISGNLRVNGWIFGYQYGINSNAAAFIFDKPGLYYTGIGSGGTTSTIRFSACNDDSTWVGYSQIWQFYGDVIANGGITMYSDLRKKNILSNEVLSVGEIAAAPLFRHTYKSDDNQYIHVGTSAQYWSSIHEDWFTRKDGEGYYQMELQNLGVAMGISLAREIVKYESKTDKKIRLMKKKINDLEARIKELEGSRGERRTA